jgi:hypothetical protein
MQAVQRPRRSAIRSRSNTEPSGCSAAVLDCNAEVGRTAESGWVEEGQCIEIDHLLQKRHSESQSAGDDFSAAVEMEETAEPYLAWRLRSGYQSR